MMKQRLNKLESAKHHKPYGEGCVFTYDAEYAKQHPVAWDAMQANVYARFPDLKSVGMFFFEPHKEGWVRHWPHTDGDEGALQEFDKQDALEAFLDYTVFAASSIAS